MQTTTFRSEVTGNVRIIVDLTDAEIDRDPGLSLIPADASARVTLLALYIHALHLEPDAEPTAAELEEHYSNAEPLSRAAAALVTLQNALADVNLSAIDGITPEEVGMAHRTLADVGAGHLDALARLIHAGDVLEKLHADPAATIAIAIPRMPHRTGPTDSRHFWERAQAAAAQVRAERQADQ